MFLYIARGSVGEVRSMLRFCGAHADFAHLGSQVSHLISLAESCSRQLRAWADSLQNSNIKGQRYLTEASRGDWEQRRRTSELLAKLDRSVKESRREREAAGRQSEDQGRDSAGRRLSGKSRPIDLVDNPSTLPPSRDTITTEARCGRGLTFVSQTPIQEEHHHDHQYSPAPCRCVSGTRCGPRPSGDAVRCPRGEDEDARLHQGRRYPQGRQP